MQVFCLHSLIRAVGKTLPVPPVLEEGEETSPLLPVVQQIEQEAGGLFVWALAQQMFIDKSHSISEICAPLGISRATLFRYVKETESTTKLSFFRSINYKFYSLSH